MSDPALEAHEHAEHAEHAAHEKDPFISRVSITIAVLAVMAAAAGSLETVEGGRAITQSSEAVLAQDMATDSWNEYQADSLKRHMYDIASVRGRRQGGWNMPRKSPRTATARTRRATRRKMRKRTATPG